MRVFSPQFLVLFKQLSDQALQSHELIIKMLRKRQNVIFLSNFYIFLFKVISTFIASYTNKFVILAVEISDFPRVRVALKSNVLLLFNLIVLRLIKIKHCQLHLNNALIEVRSDLALGAGTSNVSGVLIIDPLDKNTSHADKVPTVHLHWVLSIGAVKSALTADTFVLLLHFNFNLKII